MASYTQYAMADGTRRWLIQYRLPSKRTSTKRGFRTKRAAQQWYADYQVSVSQGRYVSEDAGKLRVSDLHAAWWDTKVRAKPAWRARLDQHWRVSVEPEWGHRAVGSITASEVQSWITALAEVQSPSSIEDIVGVLAGLLDVAQSQRRIHENAARGRVLPRREEVEREYLSHAQVHQLADEVSQYAEIVYLLAYTGLRWGEMAALRPRDIDIERGRIAVTRSASKRNAAFDMVTPKTWQLRTVAVPESVMGLLVPVIEAAPSDRSLLWSRPGDGSPLRPPNLTSWFSKAVYRLAAPERDEEGAWIRDVDSGRVASTTGFPVITAHELRHTAASLMIRSGAHIKTVQRQLGHKSAAMTLDQYGHLYDDDLDAVSGRMDTAFRAVGASEPKEAEEQSEQSPSTDRSHIAVTETPGSRSEE